jgi:hypothetical protein
MWMEDLSDDELEASVYRKVDGDPSLYQGTCEDAQIPESQEPCFKRSDHTQEWLAN